MLSLVVLIKGTAKRVAALNEDFDHCQVKEFLDSLPDRAQNRMVDLMKRMANLGKITNIEHFSPLGEGIYEFKVHSPYPVRLYCFFDSSDVICTHGSTKRGRRHLRTEIEKTKRIRSLYNKEKRSLK